MEGEQKEHGGAEPPRFSTGHVHSVRNNPMSGIALPAWLGLLWRWGSEVDYGRYWLRVLFLSFMACLNMALGLLDSLLFAATIAHAKLHPRPVFVLGHPRTGTTMLHNLLSLDDGQFYFCTTFQAGFPSGFASLNSYSWLFAGLVDQKRPMDNMKLSLDLPQEDELATNVLSGGRSQYMSIFLPRLESKEFRNFVNFEDADPEDLKQWEISFRYLLKKLSAVNDGGSGRRRILLKSPVHTGRVKLLLQLFPKAQFVYIHRNPFRVYQSMVNMANKAFPFMYLHRPTNKEIHEYILSQFVQLHSLYVRDRRLIPKGNLVEIAYDDLAKSPVKTIESIYKSLSWDGFEKMRSKFEEYFDNRKAYKKNQFSPLSHRDKILVAERWKEAFLEFNYSIDEKQ